MGQTQTKIAESGQSEEKKFLLNGYKLRYCFLRQCDAIRTINFVWVGSATPENDIYFECQKVSSTNFFCDSRPKYILYIMC